MRGLLIGLHLAVSTLAAPAASTPPSSFACALSTYILNAHDPAVEACTYTSASGDGGYLSFQWFTGTFGKEAGDGAEMVLISVYIDGETTPLSYFPYELGGTPSLTSYNLSLSAPKSTWSAGLWGRNSATSWTNSFPIPFSKSVRITLRNTAATGRSVIYYQGHGLDGVAPSFGKVALPPRARLVLQRKALALPRLAYLNVSHFDSGRGLVAAIAIAFTAPNQNTLEGCFHWYPTASMAYPGQLHSTGTEDEFLSSYYFDLGPFQARTAGVHYKTAHPTTAIAMWRTYQDDPMLFADGGAFVWRNGDTADAKTHVKCMIEAGGVPAGNPQTADVQTTSWNYVW